MKKIAIIGAGISGLTAAYLLGRRHQVTLFEADTRLGGHTCTVPVSRSHGDYAVDVGFIVFNDRTYPHFNTLMDQLGIGRQDTEMGFAVSCERTGLEYCGRNLAGIFGQRRNLLSLTHWKMIRDILRFNREAASLLTAEEGEIPLGRYLRQAGYSERFITHYALPMGGAIWSCSEARMEDFPARFFVRFFDHHGLLTLNNRPQWHVVPGGSSRYLEKLLPAIKAHILPGTPVRRVTRQEESVTVVSTAGEQVFDEVVFACHSDQALQLLADAGEAEHRHLSAIPYQDNDVVLHTDTRLLPQRQRVWSSWNALLPKAPGERIQVTYNMNMLQGISAPETFCVTLNATDRIDPARIISQHTFAHPVFTPEGMAARQAIRDGNGTRHTWFCGAWCRNGFHEDGVASALDVAQAFGETL